MNALIALLVLLPLGVHPSAQERTAIPRAKVTQEEIETFELLLHAHAQFGFGESAKPAPGLTVEYGVGMGGEHKRFVEATALAQFTADSAGDLRGTLAVPVEWKDDADAVIWSRTADPGYMRTTVKRRLSSYSPEKPLIHYASPGTTLRGRALDAAGQPVLGAGVWLQSDSMPKPSYTTSGEGGYFWANYSAAGTYRLHVRGETPGSVVGSGTREGLLLEASTPKEEFLVTLGGGQSVKGRVLDNEGAPAPGLRVLALPAGMSAYPDLQACMQAERAGGLLTGSGRTNHKGEFEIECLVDGSYDFFGGWLQGTPQKETYSSRESAKRRWTFGARLAGKQLGMPLGRFVLESDRPPLTMIRDSLRIEVRYAESTSPPLFHHFELQQDEEGDGRFWGTAIQPILLEGLAVFPIESQRDYLLTWNQPGVRYFDWSIRAPWGAQLVPLNLPKSELGGSAELTVRVLDRAGRACPREPLISILSPGSRAQIDASYSTGMLSINNVDDSQWSTKLPAGRFLIRAHDTPLTGCVISSPLQRPSYLPVELEVSLRAGKNEVVELRMNPAGLLNLRSKEAPAGPDSAERKLLYEFMGSFDADRNLARDHFGGCEVTLIDARGRAKTNLGFELLRCIPEPQDWVLPGWDFHCMDPLSPGSYTLIVSRAGTSIFEEQVHIHAGQETNVWW